VIRSRKSKRWHGGEINTCSPSLRDQPLRVKRELEKTRRNNANDERDAPQNERAGAADDRARSAELGTG